MKGRAGLGGIGLLREATFRRYYLARVASQTGTALTAAIMPLIVLAQSRSATLTGLTVTIGYFPQLLFGPVAGAMTDRMNRRRVMIISDLVSFVAMCSAPLFARSGAGLVVAVVAARLITSSAEVWFSSSNFAALPAIVGRDLVVEASTVIATTIRAISLGVPAAGVGILLFAGPAPVLLVDAATFLISAWLLSGIKQSFSLSAEPQQLTLWRAARHVRADMVEGLRYLWNHRLVRSVTIAGFLNAVAGGTIGALIAVFASSRFGIAADSPLQAAFLTMATAATLLMGPVLPPLRRRLSAAKSLVILQAAALITAAGLALSRQIGLAIALFGLWNGAYSLIVSNGISLRVQVVPDHLQGRVGTTARLIAWGGAPVGAAIGGALTSAGLSLSTVYLAMALLWLPAILVIVPLVRRPDPVTTGEPPDSREGIRASQPAEWVERRHR